jgi:hypothetical protein
MGKTCLWGAVFTLAFVANLDAQTLLSIDFSAAQGYGNGPLLGQPAGAANVWSKEPGTTPTGFDVQNGALHVDQHGGANSFIMISFPLTSTGLLTATWEWQYLGLPDSSVDNGFVLSDSANFNLDNDGSAIDFNENGAMTRMTTDTGMINAINSDGAGAGTYANVNVDYRDGRLIPMKMVVYLDNLKYDLWAEGVQVADDFGFRRNPQRGFDTLVLWNSGAAVHAPEEGMMLDNIVITGGSSNVPHWSLFE